MNRIELSKSLGWFSLALGGLELAAPGRISAGLGLPGGRWLLRGFGLREILAGFAVLTDPGALRGPIGRVAGDALDIGVLVSALSSRRNPRRGAAGLALLLVAGVTALDVACTGALAAAERRGAEVARRGRVGSAAIAG